MRCRPLWLAVAPIIVASYSAPLLADAQLAALSAPVVAQILQQVNQHRASLEGAALLPLEWDAPLAVFAAGTVATCRMQHSSNAQRQHIPGWPGQYSGENLAMAYRRGMSLADAADDGKLIRYFQQAIDGWWREQADYDYETNRCAAGKMCGHYTQLAWRQTRKIGCALAMCNPQLDVGRPGYTIACNFMPGGNLLGQRPY